MKKNIMIISGVLVVIVVIIIYVFVFMKFNISCDAVRPQNIEVKDNTVTFDYIQCDSGYYISDYKYEIDKQGCLKIRFYGTVKPLKSKVVKQVNIDTGDNYISEIQIISDDSGKSIWKQMN